MNLDRFPRHPLTFGPTPLERLERLSAHLGGKVEIWAKREDCNSGLAFGGNKIRKMEYLVPDILAKKCDTLVSIGGVQSNHTRQVAAVAAKLGLKCHLVQGSWAYWPDGLYDRVGNIQLSRVLGAEIMFSREDFSIAIKDSWQRAIEAVERAGGRPYAIPAGASDHPLDGLGYARFADELRAQERDLGARFDYLVVASASASTQAGMVVGFREEGRSAQVIGIDVTARSADTRAW
jgi:1-aminocyclopropane-1-carboxylate deaminase